MAKGKAKDRKGQLSPRAQERYDLIVARLSSKDTTCAEAQHLYSDAVINELADARIRALARQKGVGTSSVAGGDG